MQAKYGPGSVYHEIAEWEKFEPGDSGNNISITDEKPFESLKQQFKSNKSASIEFLWEFEKTNDSITELTLNVRSSNNRLRNRLAIINPFETSEYIDSLKQGLLAFKKRLNELQNAYRIKIADEIVDSPTLDCICHSSENIPVDEKANEMVRNIVFLEDYVNKNNLKLSGNPFLKVSRWNRDRNTINFDFCFPISMIRGLKPNADIQIKRITSSTSLKAIFNGNYRYSNFAWYDLLYQADEKNLKTNELPLEIFYNNPKTEGEPLNWKAEIFMPILK